MRLVASFVVLTMLSPSATAAPAPTAIEPLSLRGAELVVIDAHGTRRTPVRLAPAPGCAEQQRCYSGVAEDRALSLLVQIGPGLRALPFSVEVRAHDGAQVREVSVHFSFASRDLEVLGRDFKMVRADHAILDRIDPRWITLDGKALLFDADADGVRVARSGDKVAVDVELLAQAARPFGHLPRCGRHWRDVHGRVALLDRYLHVGDVLVAHGELLLGGATPVAISPWPDGRWAAFVITDHADQTSATTLHALLAGSSDADLNQPSGGLLGHHVPITKALFLRGVVAHDSARPQLEDPQVIDLAERARQAGIELSPHSATPITDDRRTTDEALAWFAARGSHVWIDHQPQTNCEAFGQAGWRVDTGIADLLAKHDFRDIWDGKEWEGKGLDERDPTHLGGRAPVLWPLGRLQPNGTDGLWQFRSTWAFIPNNHFAERYDAKALDALEGTRGIHIAHTYLETLHPRGTFFGRRNLLLRDPSGRVRIDPRLEGLLARLQQRDERGTMWLAPLGAIGDRVRALAQVRLRVTEAGTLAVTRPRELDGLTIELEAPVELAASEELRGQRRMPTQTRAWLTRCAPEAVRGTTQECTTELSLVGGSVWRDKP